MFCKHKWKIITEETLLSPFQQMGKVRTVKTSIEGGGSIPVWVFEQKHVVILECTKCGKLDKTITKNP